MSIQSNNVAKYILLEDPYILVLCKPSGLMVEPDRNGYPNLLQHVHRYLKISTALHQPVYAQHIHRLDRPVSGIVLFAKQKMVLKNLSEQFAERRVTKYYQALTASAPESSSGILESWHKKEKKKAVLYTENFPGSEKAILRYTVKPFAGNLFLWEIELCTGKYHQIRAQLSAAGCPVLGDHLYGSTIGYKPDAIALHACKLLFLHPVTHEKIVIEKEHDFYHEIPDTH